jgi:hypothetical protein
MPQAPRKCHRLEDHNRAVPTPYYAAPGSIDSRPSRLHPTPAYAATAHSPSAPAITVLACRSSLLRGNIKKRGNLKKRGGNLKKKRAT